LWKWKKEARVLREQEEAAEKQRIKEEHERTRRRLLEAEEKLKQVEKTSMLNGARHIADKDMHA
jgi:hypothetical protein